MGFLYVKTITEALGFILNQLGINNFLGYNLYTIFAFVLFGWIYLRTIQNSFAKKLLFGVITLYVLFATWNLLFYEGTSEFNQFSLTVEGICFIAISLYYFYELLMRVDTKHITRDAMFWLNANILFYFSGTLFIFGFSNYMMEHALTEWHLINPTINSLFNFMLILVLWLGRKK